MARAGAGACSDMPEFCQAFTCLPVMSAIHETRKPIEQAAESYETRRRGAREESRTAATATLIQRACLQTLLRKKAARHASKSPAKSRETRYMLYMLIHELLARKRVPNPRCPYILASFNRAPCSYTCLVHINTPLFSVH